MIERYTKEIYVCNRCGKKKKREINKIAPFSEVSIHLAKDCKSSFDCTREHLCDDCRDELTEILEAFFDDANKCEEA
jgi:hypothetical protein